MAKKAATSNKAASAKGGGNKAAPAKGGGKKAAPVKAAGKGGAKGGARKAATKSQIYSKLAESTKLTKAQVANFFEQLTQLIKQDLEPEGPGVFTVPGLVKFTRRVRPATPERQGRNPRTNEPMTIAAKPETTIVRARALKPVQEMVR